MTSVIFVIDDELDLLILIKQILESRSFTVDIAEKGQAALQKLRGGYYPDLIILDLLMPDINGLQVCEQIREFSTVPIIVLSAIGNDENRVAALELGADDFVNKPFKTAELVARVHAVLRRQQWAVTAPTISTYSDGALFIDFRNRQAKVGSRDIKLSPIEFLLLFELIAQCGQLVPHEVLLQRVWGEKYLNDVYLLHINFNRIRTKLGDGNVPRIRNRPKQGYWLDPVEPC